MLNVTQFNAVQVTSLEPDEKLLSIFQRIEVEKYRTDTSENISGLSTISSSFLILVITFLASGLRVIFKLPYSFSWIRCGTYLCLTVGSFLRFYQLFVFTLFFFVLSNKFTTICSPNYAVELTPLVTDCYELLNL